MRKDFTFIIAIPNGSLQEISDNSKPAKKEETKVQESIVQLPNKEDKNLYSDEEEDNQQEEATHNVDFDLQKRLDFYAAVEQEDFF